MQKIETNLCKNGPGYQKKMWDILVDFGLNQQEDAMLKEGISFFLSVCVVLKETVYSCAAHR